MCEQRINRATEDIGIMFTHVNHMVCVSLVLTCLLLFSYNFSATIVEGNKIWRSFTL